MANSIKVTMAGSKNKPAGKVDNNAEVNRQIEMMRHLDRKTMKAGTIPANLSNNGDDSFIVSRSTVTTWQQGDICDITDALKNIVVYPDVIYDVQKRIIGIIVAGNNGNANLDVIVLAKGSGYARKALDKTIVAGDLLMYASPSTWLLTPVTTDKSKAVARAEADASMTDKYVRVNLDTKGGTDGGSSYEYPFLVEKLTDNSVVLIGYNLSANPQRDWKNWITLGNNSVEVVEQTVASITATGYLYLEVTYTNTYLVTLKFLPSEALPQKTNTNEIIILRRIVCIAGKISEINAPFNVVNLGGKVY